LWPPGFYLVGTRGSFPRELLIPCPVYACLVWNYMWDNIAFW
jgi:hypothetical protein